MIEQFVSQHQRRERANNRLHYDISPPPPPPVLIDFFSRSLFAPGSAGGNGEVIKIKLIFDSRFPFLRSPLQLETEGWKEIGTRSKRNVCK